MKTILIADDSAIMRRMVRVSLRTLPGVSFEEAGSGLEVIERLALAPVDLIVLDLNMPDMHGLEVLRFLTRHSTYRRIPVMVLTTRGDDEIRSAALQAGAALYVTKPFSPGELAANAGRLLERA